MNKTNVDQCGEFWADIMEDDFASQRHAKRASGEDSSPSYKVYRMVQDILRRGISHDYQDVLEFGVEGVLAGYGWCYPPSRVRFLAVQTGQVFDDVGTRG